MKLEKEYWDSCYHEPETMDGIVNAKEHAKYAKSLFKLEQIKIKSIVDLGFGTGDMLKAFRKEFKSNNCSGVEPSKYIYEKNKQRLIKKNISVYNISLEQWSESKDFEKRIDLGLCTSVFQYIKTNDLKKIIPIMAKRLRYVYLSVPTNKELDRQINEMSFKDKYALRRTKKTYQDLLSPYFTIVGSRLLESKFHFSDKDSRFSEFLFRL